MERLQEFPFIQVGMAIATTGFFWMGLGFPVGARRGSVAGRRVLRSGTWFLLGGIALVAVWAVASGQLGEFSATMGMWELAEFSAFVVIFEFIVYFMCDRYLEDKAEEEERETAKEVETRNA